MKSNTQIVIETITIHTMCKRVIEYRLPAHY